MIRVGRCTWENGKRVDPSYPGFTSILCLTKSSPYGDLSPYMIKDDDGRIMENLWQGCKVYETIPKSIQKYSRYNSTIIWDWPAERHVDQNGQKDDSDEIILTSEYWNWRKNLMTCKYPVRYPVGYKHRHKCLFSFLQDPMENLDYIQSRKQIYLPIYDSLIRKESKFDKLKIKHYQGENLLILEVDGPHSESLDYYKQQYHVDDTFIERNTMLATPEYLKIMLEDSKHPFGHGYCLAASLLNLTDQLLK